MAGGQASLTAEEVAVAAIDRPLGAAPFVLICEHASNAFPSRYGTLGLTAAERESHIAWDPGALAVAQRLSMRLDAPLIHATISRLVIDLNRDPEAPDSIAAVSESTAVAGNAGLATEARAERVATVYRPFHDAVDRFLGARRAPTRAIVSMHSFTPVYRGVARPWHVGLIHDADDRLAMRVAAGLSRDPSLVVGLNLFAVPLLGLRLVAFLHLRRLVLDRRTGRRRGRRGLRGRWWGRRCNLLSRWWRRRWRRLLFDGS